MADVVDVQSHGNVLEVVVTGKLTTDFYKQFVPRIENMIAEHGKIRVLFSMRDFHGWTAGAIWEDIKFDFKHWRDIERLAFVGEKRWEKGMAVFCRPFTTAKIRYFDQSRMEEAREWIEAEQKAATPAK